MINKIYDSIDQAVQDVKDGSIVHFAGFGPSGLPEVLIDGLVRSGVKDITAVSNNTGNLESGITKLIERKQIKKLICTYPRAKDNYAQERILAGDFEVELVPQGTLAERIRAAGSGIEGFYTPTGVGTEVAEGKEHKEINGVMCILEEALRADVAILKAKKADRWGNLVYQNAGRNFNPIMAMAADLTIVEVEEIVELGELEPEHIVTPGIFVDRVVLRGRID